VFPTTGIGSVRGDETLANDSFTDTFRDIDAKMNLPSMFLVCSEILFENR
jgi:hypothetical protein